MNCIAIDDEPLALELICGYIIKTPGLVLVGQFTNPFKAMAFLIATKVDLVFIDINMPELSGTELLRSLLELPKIVFTTAYSEYGAESYEFNAIDYLMKPIKYERFLKAINKACEFSLTKTANSLPRQETFSNSKSILVKSGVKTYNINTEDIFYIEAAGNYMNIFTEKGKVISLLSMNEIFKVLPQDKFIRIHKSFIISIKRIDSIEKGIVIINKKQIPIGITYRSQFLNLLNLNN